MSEFTGAVVTGAEPDVYHLLHPESVAVLGASGRAGTLSWWPLHLLRRCGFRGAIYPVNRGRGVRVLDALFVGRS
jgi:acyl-CoA synthetase (NDP forming)